MWFSSQSGEATEAVLVSALTLDGSRWVGSQHRSCLPPWHTVGLSRTSLGSLLPWRHCSKARTAKVSWRLRRFFIVLGETLTEAAQEKGLLGATVPEEMQCIMLGAWQPKSQTACHIASWIQEWRVKRNRARLWSLKAQPQGAASSSRAPPPENSTAFHSAQFAQLGTKCWNTGAYGGHFTF